MRLGHNDGLQQHYANLIVYISLAVGGNVFLMFQIPLLPLYHHYLSMFSEDHLENTTNYLIPITPPLMARDE